MAASSYDEALARLLAHEGGYSNHPSDPGGPTNFGITIYDYRRYLKPNATAADVRTMKVEDAKAIYRSKYWDAMRCDELAPGVDYCIFDYGVNSGTGRAPKVLQRLIRAPVTGRMDDATVRLARAHDSKRLIADICDERLAFLQGLSTWRVFGNGWGRRVREVRAAALAMAARAGAKPADGAVVTRHRQRRGAGKQNCASRRGRRGRRCRRSRRTAKQRARRHRAADRRNHRRRRRCVRALALVAQAPPGSAGINSIGSN